MWPMSANAAGRVLARVRDAGLLAVDRRSGLVVVSEAGAVAVPLDGGDPRRLRGFEPHTGEARFA